MTDIENVLSKLHVYICGWLTMIYVGLFCDSCPVLCDSTVDYILICWRIEDHFSFSKTHSVHFSV